MSEGDFVSRYPKQLLSALSTIVYEITPKLYRVVCVGLFISNLANFAIAKMCNLSCFVVIDNIWVNLKKSYLLIELTFQQF